MRLPIVVILALTCGACDLNVYPASTPIAPTPTSTPITVSNTNTNTNTATTDRSDTGPAPSSGGGDTPAGAVLPLPAYGEPVTRDVAAANPSLLANSCQETSGESAWQFLDLVISTLRARDQRWGYLCKQAACSTYARDVVAYRASTSNTGIWIVDVIGNHCSNGTTDPPPAVRWGVLPFETERPWAGSRK